MTRFRRAVALGIAVTVALAADVADVLVWRHRRRPVDPPRAYQRLGPPRRPSAVITERTLTATLTGGTAGQHAAAKAAIDGAVTTAASVDRPESENVKRPRRVQRSAFTDYEPDDRAAYSPERISPHLAGGES